jgi:hypothetical protein
MSKSTIKRPYSAQVYALIGPLRILRWKKADPGVWAEILKLSSHIEERRQDIRWSWIVNRLLPIAEECGVQKEDLDFLGKFYKQYILNS